MNLLCKVFGHKMRDLGWVGARSTYFGAVSVNVKECKWCGKRKHEYTTVMEPLRREEQV